MIYHLYHSICPQLYPLVNIFLSISFNICFGTKKNRLTETVLLSTHNICFGQEIRKL